MEWYDKYPTIAEILGHIQDEGLFEEMTNGYVDADKIPDVSEYARIKEILSELRKSHDEFTQWEEHLYKEMNKFLPEEERLYI